VNIFLHEIVIKGYIYIYILKINMKFLTSFFQITSHKKYLNLICTQHLKSIIHIQVGLVYDIN